jgi:selenocysteine lyase/cysteine desulfurase
VGAAVNPGGDRVRSEAAWEGGSDAVERQMTTRHDETYAQFLAEFPEYEGTRSVDELRGREFGRLDGAGHVYLDYTGSGLYAACQVKRHGEMLLQKVLGNPHSSNPTSEESTRLVDETRRRVLRFFGAPEDEYAVVFAANASHALKLVGEAYPFGAGDRFLLTFDNHNSVNGIREFDRARGATTTYVPMIPPELRADEEVLLRHLDRAAPGRHNLFAYPAQSNFSGVRHPLEWTEWAQSRGWDVLLDAAAFLPTSAFDLGRWRPEFVALSFYKMFGFPTGVGALLAKKTALEKLHRPWFAGGTINVASVQADRFVLAAGSAAFEDGTVDFTNIPAIAFGLDVIESIGLDVIGTRVRLLTEWLIGRMTTLTHGNGRPLVRLYGPASTHLRGGTIAFNFQDAGGRVVEHRAVERQAAERGISLRTGCFCNPGAGELALGLSRSELEHCFAGSPGRMTYEDLRSCIDPKAAGAVRISLGLVSSFADVFAFVEFAESLRSG